MTEESKAFEFPAQSGGKGYLLTEEISGASETLPGYHLYPGDLLQDNGDGTYTKLSPGLGIMGLRLTPEQRERLKPVSYWADGLTYHLSEES